MRAVCLCLSVCDIQSEYLQKQRHLLDLSKLDGFLHKKGSSGTMLPKLHMCRSIISLSKTAQSRNQS